MSDAAAPQTTTRHTTAPPTTAAPAPPRRGWPQVLRWIGVFACAAGWWISFNLLTLTAGGNAPVLAPLCGEDAGGGSGCASVLRSAYAFYGSSPDAEPRSAIPWAVIGMAYYALLGAWLLFVGPATRERWYWQVLVLLIATIAVLSSLSLMSVMAWELEQWCGGCVAAHVVNGVLFLVLLLTVPITRPKTPQRRHPLHAHASAALVAGVTLAVLHLAGYGFGRAQAIVNQYEQQLRTLMADAEYVAWEHSRAPLREIPVREDALLLGDPDTPHRVVLFSDPQCGACQIAHALLTELQAQYPDRLHVVYKFFPQSPRCNSTVKTDAHPHACRATAAVHAVQRLQGDEAALAFVEKVFEFQRQLPVAGRLLGWAAGVGADKAAVAAALDDPEIDARIQADIELARELGEAAMPAIYLNGRKVKHWRDATVWPVLLGVEAPATGDVGEKPAADDASTGDAAREAEVR